MTTPSTYYFSTAIAYTNGPPHFGHAYEAVAADAFSRYSRNLGNETYFQTGTDEHGQKVADTAAAQDPPMTPIALCDKYVGEFQALNKKLDVAYDFYSRTTDPEHEKTCQWLWQQSAESGDIYLANYEGWYSTREEKFVTETEAQAMDYKDGDKPLQKTSEPSYFFKLSKYQDKLVKHIEDNERFIYPAKERNGILARLKEPMHDLSISRTTFDWGIPVPDEFKGKGDEAGLKHVMYVWFDALTNYLSGIGYPNGEKTKFWPANVQLIGKDISWFHCVIWPCMLFSANIPLPETVLCHGFVNGPDGRKMSKSWGNVVDPVAMLDKYTSDHLRYFMLREGSFGSDFAFAEPSLIDRHDTELAANLGNLARRSLTLSHKYCDGKSPAEEPEQLFSVQEIADEVAAEMKDFQIQNALAKVFSKLTDVNKWITEQAPWKLKGDNKEEIAATQRKCVRTLLESIYILIHFLDHVIPNTTSTLFSRFGTAKVTIPELLKSGWNAIVPGTPLQQGEALFQRLTDNRFVKKQQGGAKQPQPKGKKAQQQKKGAKAALNGPLDISRLSIKVGVITDVSLHPKAEHLYVETVDVGEDKPRQICSGLAKFIPIEKMQGARLCVITNMKPSNFRGVRSEGMVLAAANEDKTVIELVSPPADAAPGTVITAVGYPGDPEEVLNPKLKTFDKLKPLLKSNEDLVATFDSVPLTTPDGATCTVPSLPNAQIS